MPAALPFIGPAIGGIGSIIGGVKGSGAAQQAGQIQYQASQQAIQQIQKALAQINPPIQTAADKAAADALQAGKTAGTGLTTAAGAAGTGVTNAAQAANVLLNPYMQTGAQANTTLAGMMAPGGQLVTPFSAQMMQATDPGYQFRKIGRAHV